MILEYFQVLEWNREREKLERPNEPIGIKDGLRELIARGLANRDVCNGSWE
jgi:hypothetical protein